MYIPNDISEMSPDGQALDVCDYLQESKRTITTGGTICFGDFRNFNINNEEIETLLDYMFEKDMLIVVRCAPGKITDENQIRHEELFTYNNYSGIIPSELFRSVSITDFYKSSPQGQILDMQKSIRTHNSTFGKLKDIAQSVYDTILDNPDTSESSIFDVIKNCNPNQLNSFLELNPFKFADTFYEGVPTDYMTDKEPNKSALADYFVRKELASLPSK